MQEDRRPGPLLYRAVCVRVCVCVSMYVANKTLQILKGLYTKASWDLTNEVKGLLKAKKQNKQNLPERPKSI